MLKRVIQRKTCISTQNVFTNAKNLLSTRQRCHQHKKRENELSLMRKSFIQRENVLYNVETCYPMLKFVLSKAKMCYSTRKVLTNAKTR